MIKYVTNFLAISFVFIGVWGVGTLIREIVSFFRGFEVKEINLGIGFFLSILLIVATKYLIKEIKKTKFQ